MGAPTAVFLNDVCLLEIETNIEGLYALNFFREVEDIISNKPIGHWVTLALDLKRKFEFEENSLKTFLPIAKQIKRLGRQVVLINPTKEMTTMLEQNGLDSLVKPVKGFSLLENYNESTGKNSQPPSKVDVEFINPFINAVLYALQIQCDLKFEPSKPKLKTPKDELQFDVVATITMKSNGFNGYLSFCWSFDILRKVMCAMMGEDDCELSPDDLLDGLAELLNIAFGNAKKELNEKNFEVESAIPRVITKEEMTKLEINSKANIVLTFSEPKEQMPLYLMIMLN